MSNKKWAQWGQGNTEQRRATGQQALKRRRARAIVMLLIANLLAGCALFQLTKPAPPQFQLPKIAKPLNNAAEEATKPRTEKASILCTGDIVVHEGLRNAGNTGNGYDYTGIFEYAKADIEGADVAFVCLESPLMSAPYSGFPRFRAPEAWATSLAGVGYDTVIWANNHANDQGDEGMFHTMDVIEDAGMSVAGVRRTENEPRYLIHDVGNVKIAMVAYTYGMSDPATRNLNGLPLSEKGRIAVNSFSNATFAGVESAEFKQVVDEARAAGADLVIGYFHWGEEYQTTSNDNQKRIADWVAKNTDVDVIIGSHPHNPQESTVIDRSDSNSGYTGADTVPVYYSMGNLLSSQRRESLEQDRTGHTELGYMIRLDATFDGRTGELTDLKTTPIPYWLDVSGSGYGSYKLIPLKEGYQDLAFLKQSGHRAKADEAKREVERILQGK